MKEEIKSFIRIILLIYVSMITIALVLAIVIAPLLLVAHYDNHLWFLLYFIIFPVTLAIFLAYLEYND